MTKENLKSFKIVNVKIWAQPGKTRKERPTTKWETQVERITREIGRERDVELKNN